MIAAALTPTELRWEKKLDGVKIRRLGFLRDAKRNAKLRKAVRLKCESDPLWFLRHLIWGFDPRRSALGLQPRTPFLPYDEQEVLFLAILNRRNIAMDKSRDTGASYIAAAAVLYSWLFRPGSVWGLSSKTGGEASNGTPQSLMGKVQFMLRHLPRWMQPRMRFRNGPPGWMFNIDNGAEIIAKMTTPDVWHSQRCTGIVFDEIARTPHPGRMVNGAAGSTNQVVLITTPNGSFGWWPKLINGDGEKIQELDVAALLAGTDPEPGYHHYQLHWRMDPRYCEEWARRKQLEMSAVEWLINYEISYEASTPGKIWPEFSRHKHVLGPAHWAVFVRDYLPHAEIFEANDVGFHTSFVWAAYVEELDELVVLDCYSQVDEKHTAVVSAMESMKPDWAPDGIRTSRNPLGLLPYVRTGDPAMRTRDSATLDSWLDLLAAAGVVVTPPRALKGKTAKLRARVSDALTAGKIWFSPHCLQKRNNLPSLVDAVEQYRLELRAGSNRPKPAKGPESHPCDALQYLISCVWPSGVAAGIYKIVDGKKVLDAGESDDDW